MPGLVAPRQARSHRSLESMVAALEHLLRDRPFEEISVAEICRSANVTTGAFYARFQAKDSLMPYVYERYQAWLSHSIPAQFDRVDWQRCSPRPAAEKIAQVLIALYAERPWLLRAVTLFARSGRGNMAAHSGQASRDLVHAMKRVLELHFVVDTENAHRALDFALFALISTAREAVLFPSAPVASVAGKWQEPTLSRQLGALLTGHLLAEGVEMRAPKKKTRSVQGGT